MTPTMLVAFYPARRFDGGDFYMSIMGSAYSSTSLRRVGSASLLNRNTTGWAVHAVNGSSVCGVQCGEVAPQFDADDSLTRPTR